MEETRTVQTAFRFKPDTVRRLKNRARAENKSVNVIVETLIENYLGAENDRYEAIYEELKKRHFEPRKELSEWTKTFSTLSGKLKFTEEELNADPRLRYILRTDDEDIF